MRRISWFLPRNALLTFYFAYLAPYYDYCSTVWDPCCISDSHRLQLTQNFAARLILKKNKFSSATDSLVSLGWATLAERRQMKLKRLCTSIHPDAENPIPHYLSNLFHKVSNHHSHNTRASSNGHLKINRIRTNYGKHAISYKLAKLFNYT